MNLQLGAYGLIAATAIALVAVRRGSLTHSGALGAILIGGLTLAFGGWLWGALIVTFFVSSTLLSHLKAETKSAAALRYDKSHRRDFGQVMANGGLATAIAVMNGVQPGALWLPCFVGIIATVTADTWATELGGLSRRPPRLITTWKPVEPGTSGGVSAVGLLASLAGGLLIGAIAVLWEPAQWQFFLLLAGLSGLAGSLCDSLLGATVQRIYFDADLPGESERARTTGGALPLIRGWTWMSNDMVNLVASACGGILAVGFALLT
jgi:uncharacterized protein (TIGR00297 family)